MPTNHANLFRKKGHHSIFFILLLLLLFWVWVFVTRTSRWIWKEKGLVFCWLAFFWRPSCLVTRWYTLNELQCGKSSLYYNEVSFLLQKIVYQLKHFLLSIFCVNNEKLIYFLRYKIHIFVLLTRTMTKYHDCEQLRDTQPFRVIPCPFHSFDMRYWPYVVWILKLQTWSIIALIFSCKNHTQHTRKKVMWSEFQICHSDAAKLWNFA